MNRNNLQQILIKDEDLRLKPYLDSQGLWTYGVGRLIGARLQDLKISEATARQMLSEDIETATVVAVRIFSMDVFCSWTQARQDAVLALLFNMGAGTPSRGFLSFRNGIRAINDGNWSLAATHFLHSLWAKQVDPLQRPGEGRDDRIAYMLETGEYHPWYGLKTTL